MAEIKPFNGLRFTEKAGRTEDLCCPPYDIVSAEEKQSYTEKNPHNIIRLELPKASAQDGDNAYSDAAKCLDGWLKDDILARDEKAGIYVYEMKFSLHGVTRAVKGFISLVKLEDFSKGVILPHEETLSKAKADRFELMCATGCNFSQIYSLYSDPNGSMFKLIDECSSKEPDSSYTDRDGVTHSLWCVYDGNVIDALVRGMADKKLYIADGHHRYETALKYRDHIANTQPEKLGSSEYVTMMMVNIENDGLTVFPTHRIVRDLPNFDLGALTEKCSEYFEITPYLNREKGEIGLEKAYSENKKAFVLFTGDNNYTLMVLKDAALMESLMPNASKALRELDVSVLHTLVLERIFGIDKQNMAEQINLTYTRSADEALAAVDGKRANCCFLLNPTRVSEIRDVAAAGEKMPQKSTYFYPKLATGLVMNKIF